MSLTSPRLRLILAIGFAVAVQLALANVRTIEADEGLFGACAVRQIVHAALPLTDCVDIKPPGIFLLYEAAYRLFGNYEGIGLRLIWIGFALVLAMAVRQLARLRSADGGDAAALTLLLLTTSNFFLALKTELPAVALATVATAIVRPSAVRLLAAGGLVGLATLFKQPVALMLLPCLIAVRPTCVIDLATWTVRGALLALGWAVPLSIVASLYFLSGRWTGFAEQMWSRPVLYALHKTPGFAMVDALGRSATQLLPTLGIIALFVTAAVIARRRAPIARYLEIWTFLGTGLVVMCLGGHFFPSYAIVAIPPLALLLCAPQRGGSDGKRGWLLAYVATLAAVALATTTVMRLRASDAYDASLGRQIDAAAQPGDGLYVWGYVPELYPAVGRVPASRFVVTSMLFGFFHDSDARTPVYAGMRFVKAGDWPQFIGELRRGPILFLDTSAIRMGAPHNFPPEAFATMRDFLRTHCKEGTPVRDFRLYRCAR